MKKWIESSFFEKFIITVIALNSITLGLETVPSIVIRWHSILSFLDKVFLSIFCVEIVLKLYVNRLRFFKDPWGVFDFVIVTISLLPTSGPFSVLRALRVLRTLRMVSVVPSLRRVIQGLLIAIPGLGAVGAIMCLLFYVGSVMATRLFGETFPEWFGSIAHSAYTLFQVMTLESWSMGIVRPVMEKFPYSWMFFLPFILVTTFTTLNLFIAVIVNAMQAETDAAAAERAQEGHDERAEMLNDIKQIKASLLRIEQQSK